MVEDIPSVTASHEADAISAMRGLWALFVIEGVILALLGVVAIVVPSIAGVDLTQVLGWLFLVSGVVGLLMTAYARRAPGFWWSLVSALLAISVGAVMLSNTAQNLYGGLMGWPLESVGPLRLILVLFFLVEGGASIMFAFEHRRRRSGRWGWMLTSGLVDIGLASMIIFDLPGSSAWTMGLLVAVNMITGGVALTGIGLHARMSGLGSEMLEASP